MEFSSLTFSSTGNTLEEVLRTLVELDAANCFSFPYADIRHIYKTVTSRKKLTRRVIKKGFGPDLNTYQMAVAGPSRWCHLLLEWPFKKRQNLADWLEKDFFRRVAGVSASTPLDYGRKYARLIPRLYTTRRDENERAGADAPA